MRKFGFALGVLAVVAVACNALTGVGDLAVCTNGECEDARAFQSLDASGTDAPIALVDGDVPPGTDPDASMVPTSCRATALTCGTENVSCCQSLAVPGGSFDRANDDDWPATVSPFFLDTFEVTVGRFRAFVESGGGTATSPPAVGSGAHPKIAGSGWKASWNSQLSNTTDLFRNALNESTTFTREARDSEQKPMSAVTWFEAFAFCAWDGGRLPTFAELSFASTGGSEQRYYPWSSPPRSDAIDPTRAAYECNHSPPSFSCPPPLCVGANPAQSGTCNSATCADAGGSCQDPPCTGCDTTRDIAFVGQYPTGAGRWGHLDLAGNVTEITMDARPRNDDQLLPVPCNDCARLMRDNPAGTSGSSSDDDEILYAHGDFGDERSRIGSFSFGTEHYRSRFLWLGFRCARDP